jgi:hypothetical protein
MPKISARKSTVVFYPTERAGVGRWGAASGGIYPDLSRRL